MRLTAEKFARLVGVAIKKDERPPHSLACENCGHLYIEYVPFTPEELKRILDNPDYKGATGWYRHNGPHLEWREHKIWFCDCGDWVRINHSAKCSKLSDEELADCKDGIQDWLFEAAESF